MRTLLYLAAIALSSAAASPARAFEFYWQASGDALYSAADSWNPLAGAPPKASDRAIFDRGSLGVSVGAAVDFNTNPVNERLIVRNDDVTLRLGGRLYTLNNSLAAAPSLVVSDASGQESYLRLENGTVQSVHAVLGLGPLSYGRVEINSAVWNNSQALTIGGSGDGEVSIEQGGQVFARTAALASQGETSYGRVDAVGSTARMTISEQLTVAAAGYAEMFVEAGARVSNASAVIGDIAFSTGIVSITGEGSTWSNSLDLTVGDAGYGELNIYDGAAVTSQGAAIARAVDSTGIATLYGGTWVNSGEMHIGGSGDAAGGTGTLVIDYGAMMAVSGVTRVHPGGLLSIRGGTFETGSLENLGGIEYIVGVLHLTASDLVIGEAGVLGPVLALTPDMYTIVDQHTTVDSTGHIAAIEGSFSSRTITNNGRLSIVTSAMQFDEASTNSPTGRISMIDGNLATGRGANRLLNQGRIDIIDSSVNGDIHNATGSAINLGGAVLFDGLISGSATFTGSGSVTFNRGFSPADGAAQVEFGGDVSFGEEGMLSLQLGGALAGSQYDQIQIAGAAALDGVLAVTTIDGFIPAAGQSFSLLQYSVHSGSFDSVSLPTLPASLTWNIDYGASALTISVGSESLAGDLNLDGAVGVGDVARLLLNYGRVSGATAAMGDLTTDGRVSLADLIQLRALFSPPASAAAAVPEPGAFPLAAVGLAALAYRKAGRRRRFAV